MGNSHPEQLCRKHVKTRPCLVRWLKRRAAKLRRQAERRDPENAPRRNQYAGWSD
jgi:hypothetical protein